MLRIHGILLAGCAAVALHGCQQQRQVTRKPPRVGDPHTIGRASDTCSTDLHPVEPDFQTDNCERGKTPSSHTIDRGEIAPPQRLEASQVEHAADAVYRGDVNAVRQLLESERRLVSARTERHSYTLLHLSVPKGHVEIARMLLDSGAEVDARCNHQSCTNTRETPLHFAADRRSADMVSLLIEYGADVNASVRAHESDTGRTPLHIAAEAGLRRNAELLIAASAELDSRDSEGFTPLHVASWKGNYLVASLLLAKGARLDLTSSRGRRPIDLAKLGGHKMAQNEVIQLLTRQQEWSKREEAQARMPVLHDPLLLAFELRSVMKLGDEARTRDLIASGADIDARYADGSTPLHVAAMAHQPAIVRALLNSGASVNARCKSGRTPLKWATGTWGTDDGRLERKRRTEKILRNAGGTE